MENDNIKQKYQKLLEKTYEFEGLLHLEIARDDAPKEVETLIKSKLEELNRACAFLMVEKSDDNEESFDREESDGKQEDSVNQEELTDMIEEFEGDELLSYEIEDEDDDELIEDEEEFAGEVEFEEEADADIDADDLTSDEPEEVKEQYVEVNKRDAIHIDRHLQKKFSLNDMFRFSALFGNNRQKLSSSLEAMNGMNDSEIEEYFRNTIPHSDEELKEEFLMKILGEKE